MKRIAGMGFMACLAAAQGVISTYAGTDWIFPGDGAQAVNTPLGKLFGISLDPAGNVIVADFDNCIVARVGANGILSVLAGNGICLSIGDGGPATAAALDPVISAVYDPQGNLYIATNGRIRRVTAAGIIGPFAGSGITGFGGDNGPATKAQFSYPASMVADAAGNLYVADQFNNRVRKITQDGTITTFAGNGSSTFSGDGAAAAAAGVEQPTGLAFDRTGNLFICESLAGRIRKVTPAGVISTVYAGLPAPSTVVFDATGNMFIGGFSVVFKASPGAAAPVLFAGNPLQTGFSGDGGTALNALFNGYLPVAVGRGGEVYVADVNNFRVRRIALDGTLANYAGNGNFRYNGEGVKAAVAVFDGPRNVTFDSAGNLFVTESRGFGGAQIRKITPAGIVTTYGGNRGHGINVPIFYPYGLAFDAAGNLYIADSSRGLLKVTPAGATARIGTIFPISVRVGPAGDIYAGGSGQIVKIDSSGRITTVAGNGTAGFSGDNGPAAQALIDFSIAGLAFDRAGNLYFSETSGNRIRRITTAGIISTVAGTGKNALTPASGPALQTPVGSPGGLAFDSADNLYIASGSGAVRVLTPQGAISTFAGGANSLTIGDGKIATAASLGPSDVVLDAAGNLYIADFTSNRVRIVLAQTPTMQASPANISLAAPSGGAPVSQSITVQGSITGLEFNVAIDTGTAAKWLTAEYLSADTPRVISLTADPTILAPGDYSARVTITPVAPAPAKIVTTVAFHVGAALPPALSIDKPSLSFTFPRGGTRRTSTLTLSNTGGGTILVTASAASSGAPGSILAVSPQSAKISPGKPASLTITADPTGLDPGTYAGKITIKTDTAAGDLTVPATITVSALAQALQLTQSALAFTSVVQGGIVPPQTFGVVNVGTGIVNWTVSTSTLSGGQSWLVATPASGSSDAAGVAPKVSVSVNPAGLAPGVYYGLVRITAPLAANTPQVVTVFLEVLPAGSDPGALVRPSELVFPYSGFDVPGSLTFLVYNIGAAAKSFRTGYTGAFPLFISRPQEGVLDPAQPTRIVVQPTTAAGSPQSNTLTLETSDGRVIIVRLLFVPAQAAGGSVAGREAACSPSRLIPALTTLGQSFSVSAGWPVALGVDVRDDCGNPHTSGSVSVSFSNGDPPLSLLPLKDGSWQATWQAGAKLSQVSLKVDAVNPQLQIAGSREISGALSSQKDPPALTAGSVGSAAGFVSYSALSPGGIISIYGNRLADNTDQNKSVPLPSQLGNTQVIIAGQTAPLFYASQSQINAQVPGGINVNTTHQVLVQRGLTYSQPVSIDVGPAQPAAFLYEGSKAIAIAYRGSDSFLVGSSQPTTAGDVLVIYCTGLGATDQNVADGAASPSNPVARTKSPVTVTIGGKAAPVSFAGLVAGFVGLYQINAAVPDGVPPGDAVPLVLSVAGQTGPQSSIAVR